MDKEYNMPEDQPQNTPKIRDLPIFKEKTIQETQTFILNVERYFRQGKKLYHNNDQRKIDDYIATF